MSARKKKKAENLSLFDEAEKAPENKNALAATPANNDQGLTEPEFVRMEKNIAAFGFFTPASKRSKETPPKIIKFTQIIDGNRAEAKVTIAGNTLYGMPTTADQDKYLAFQKILERIVFLDFLCKIFDCYFARALSKRVSFDILEINRLEIFVN